jgi:hypothetical protein
MPGPNPANTGKNIAFYMREGRPRAQAVAIAMSRRRQAGLNTPNGPNPSARARQVASPNARFNRLNIARSHMSQRGQNPDLPGGVTSVAAKKKAIQATGTPIGRLQTFRKSNMSLPKFESMRPEDLEQLKKMLSSRNRTKAGPRPVKPRRETGPHPSARAYERANANARFKRGMTNPNTRREVIERMRAKRKNKQARHGLSKMRKRIPTSPRGTQS